MTIAAAGQRQHLDAFLQMLAAERGAAQNTLEAYRRDLDDFLAFLDRRACRSLRPSQAEIGAYLREPVGGGAGAGLARAAALRHPPAVQVPGRRRRDRRGPGARALPGPKKSRPLPKTLSVAEVDRLIEAARRRTESTKGRDHVRALRLHALIETLYATGLRVTELVTLPRSVLAGDGRVLTIKGKGGRERIVPLTPAARAALDRYLNVGRGGRRPGADAAGPNGCSPRAARRGI